MSVLFLAAGLGFGALFAVRAWRDVRIFTVWKKTTCTIVDTRISSIPSHKGGALYRPEITFEYSVAGTVEARDGGVVMRCTGWDSWALSGEYGGASREYYQRALGRFEIGRSYPCWYDPTDPSQAVLVRRLRPLYVLGVLPLAFLVLGALGLQAGLARPSSRTGTDTAPRTPSKDEAISTTSSLHTRLAVRLEPERTHDEA